MAQAKRIVVSLPDSLLRELDGIVQSETGNRSALIREAVSLLITERHEREQREKWRAGYGYKQIGALNRRLAEEGLAADVDTLQKYENYLSEEGKKV